MKRNKKQGCKNREKIMRSEQKLKSDFINFYDYCNFFYDTYMEIESDRQRRNNLKAISKQLTTVEIESGDINE